ncbi:hypothetical protein [Nocardia cyriacigeorgica]|uniref:Cysteine dioxygenase n=1 Tax=Nocardia cyriacigeorgica TaxID=135487 RepID=A0A5R8NAR7_9NOCA|nr:hypothetical protein [Nocardia cyriacigeorgica]MBF6093968.1 hypothetical protein [Nocardia cyriacigeorgica]TLF72716.1 hypothetical protein FEK34_28690 [Nocardia cyriacigeorgica]TLG12470.1 hypothetical protein FEK35_11225 [Nocardia cyriacigeorgica]
MTNPTTRTLDTVAQRLSGIDWHDIDQVENHAAQFFDDLAAEPDLVRDRLDELPDRPELWNLCEHYDILDKIVLHDNPDTGVRVRLHIFLPGYFDRPHNHRWSYASRILHGHYRHYLFGNTDIDEHIDPAKLPVLQARTEPIGASYALHHSMVHAVVAEPHTVSLVVRGPALKDRFLVSDRKTGEVWWQYGAARETSEDALRKHMTREQLAEVIASLRNWNLF